MSFYSEKFQDTKKRKYRISLICPFVRASRSKKRLVMTALVKYRFEKPLKLSDMYLKIGGLKHAVKIITPFQKADSPRKKGFGIMRIVIKQSELGQFGRKSFVNLYGDGKARSMMFHGLANSYKRRTSRPYWDTETNTICYFEEATNGKLMLSVRVPNEMDKPVNKAKTVLAYILAGIAGVFSKKRPIYMYEKFGRYEEGASILYEKLMDEGYTNAYYVANDALLPKDLPEKYRKNIISQYSFKQYYTYFRSYTFAATEHIKRAVELDSPSYLIWKHYRKGYDKVTHIHLQHGVMYMLCMGADDRYNTRKESREGFYKQIFIISSEKEAQHFLKYGGYDRDELYLSGLPKFDKAVLYDIHDKIVIMPTWRPWELNQALHDAENTSYYAFTKRIMDAVPEELKDKMIVLSHPLFSKVLRGDKEEYTKSYDEILRETKVLITDYSSISYDSFYRGSNVIFDWSDKEHCLEMYGNGAALMLQEDEAFGYVTRTEEELREAIIKAYNEPQKQEFIDNYNTIVEFHDNRDSERVIEFMKRDGLL